MACTCAASALTERASAAIMAMRSLRLVQAASVTASMTAATLWLRIMPWPRSRW